MRVDNLLCGSWVLGLALTVLPPTVSADDWPQYRGPGRDGVWPEPVSYDVESAGQLTVAERWRHPLGAGYSGITIVDGRLYTMVSRDGNDFVVSLDADSGKELWRTDAGPTRPGGPGQLAGPISTPTVSEGTVFTLTPSGRLLALAGTDGKVRWQRELVADLGAAVPRYGLAASPLVDGGKVFVLIGGEAAYTAAFDVETGEVAWSEGHGTGESYASLSKAKLAGVEQILVPSGEFLYAVDFNRGTLLWSHDPGPQGMVDRMPLILPDDRLFLPTMHGGVMLKVRRDADAWQIEELWRTPRLGQNTHGPPLYYDGHLYGINGSLLVCISAADGTVQWRSRVYDGTLILVDGHLVVMSAGSGKLHLVKAAPESFDEVLQLPLLETGHHTVTPPSYADRTLFVRNVRELVALELRPSDGQAPTVATTGQTITGDDSLRELWRRPLATGIESAGNAGLVATDQRVFTIVTDATSEHAVAHDLADGKELWRSKLGKPFEGRDTGLASTPTTAGELVITLGAECRLRAHSQANGEVRWQHDLAATYRAEDCRTSPRVLSGKLLLQIGNDEAGRVVALRPTDGEEIWAVQGQGPSTGASIVGAELGGVEQALVHGYTMRDGGPKSELYGVRLSDGKTLWTFGAEVFFSWADPLVTGDRVMLPTWRNSYLLDLPTPSTEPSSDVPLATELWRSEMLDSAVYRDGIIYAYIGDELVAADATDGTFLWRERNNYGKVTLSGDRLYILAYNTGVLRVAIASREGYRELARQVVLNPGAVNNVAPLVHDGTILVRNKEEIVALRPVRDR